MLPDTKSGGMNSYKLNCKKSEIHTYYSISFTTVLSISVQQIHNI